MSSAGRGSEREERDYYQTPSWPTKLYLAERSLPGGRWLEPAVGGGAIIKAVNEVRSDIIWDGVDIEPQLTADEAKDLGVEVYKADFLKVTPQPMYDVVITNPPFFLAYAFIQHALLFAPLVVMLLRIGILESRERAPWMRAHPPDIYFLPNRPSFVKGRTDSCSYAWFEWAHRRPYGELRVLPLRS